MGSLLLTGDYKAVDCYRSYYHWIIHLCTHLSSSVEDIVNGSLHCVHFIFYLPQRATFAGVRPFCVICWQHCWISQSDDDTNLVLCDQHVINFYESKFVETWNYLIICKQSRYCGPVGNSYAMDNMGPYILHYRLQGYFFDPGRQGN